MRDNSSRAAATRSRWLETLDRYMQDRDVPGSADYWSPRLDTASRDEITAIQDAKITAVVPFLYENSGFYRRRFERFAESARGISPRAAHRSGHEPLDSSGSCHRTKAAAFH